MFCFVYSLRRRRRRRSRLRRPCPGRRRRCVSFHLRTGN